MSRTSKGWLNALASAESSAEAERKAYQRGRLEALQEVVAMLEQRAEWAKPRDAKLAFLNAARGVAELAELRRLLAGVETTT